MVNKLKAEAIFKKSYVGSARIAGQTAKKMGILPWLEKKSEKYFWAHWLRSLFCIYDIDQMVKLDVPWWTYSSIARVNEFLASRPNARVFEYGSGASTLWLARRAGTVTSVEHDRDWYEIVAQKIEILGQSENTALVLVTPDDTPANDPIYVSQKHNAAGANFSSYAQKIEDFSGLFDVIVIDGRSRAACLRHSIRKLSPGGLIVFDNSKRKRYADAIDSSGLKIERFRGLVPSLPYPEETTLLEKA